MNAPIIAGSLRGVARLARFRADGLAAFAATPTGFVNSLAPLLVFPSIGAVMLLVTGASSADVANLLSSLIALLAPPVLSHSIAMLWRRDERWLRYAVAFNWCQTAITLAVVLFVGLMVASSDDLAGGAEFAIMLLLVYWIGICWFLASRGLGVTWWQAIAIVIVVNLGTAMLTIGPRLAAGGTPT